MNFTKSRNRVAALISLIALTLFAGCVAQTTSAAIPPPETMPVKVDTSLSAPVPDVTKKPNIVQVLVDDMRVDELRHAPNLRALMRHGIEFKNMFSGYPLCCPARASLNSGRLTHNHGVYTVNDPYGYRAFDDRQTLATSLKAAGYRNGFIGKYLNNYGYDPALAPKLRWLEENPGASIEVSPQIQSQYYVPDGWDDWKAGLQKVECDPACGNSYLYWHYAYTDNGVPKSAPEGQYSSHFIGTQSVDMARKFSRQREQTGNPFFMSINYIAPHNGGGPRDPLGRRKIPYTNGVGARDLLSSPSAPDWAFDVPSVKAIKSAPGILPDGTTEPDVSDKPGAYATYQEFDARTRRAVAILAKRRAAAVHVADRNIGRLIEQLKDSDEWERTVFVFWSDNGFFLGEHRRPTGKGLMYDESLRVPLIMSGPGMRSGVERHDPIDVPSLTATLLDIGDAEPPHRPDGRSMLDVALHGDRGWDTAIQIESAHSPPVKVDEEDRVHGFRDDPRSIIGVRTERYLYVRYDDGSREIYDNLEDPRQWHNLDRDARWLRRNDDVVQTLESLWEDTRACKGEKECRPPLPPQVRRPSYR